MALRYWVSGSGVWSDNTNHWSSSSGGSAGASKPGSVDVARFDGNSGGGVCTFDESPHISTFLMDPGNNTDVTTSAGADFDLLVGSGFSIEGNATFFANASTITVTAGNIFVLSTSTLLDAGTSTFDFTSTGQLQNARNGNAFHIIKVAASTKTTTLLTNLKFRMIEIGAGTFACGAFDPSTFGIQDGDKIITTHASSTVTGTGRWTIRPPGTGTTVTMDGFISTGMDFNVESTAGTVQLVTRALSLGRFEVQSDGAVFDANGQDFNCDQQMNLGFGGADATFLCGSGTITVKELFIEGANSSTLDLESCLFKCYTDFKVTNALHIVIGGTSTVEMIGTVLSKFVLSNAVLNDVKINKSSNGVFCNDALSCNKLEMIAGDFDFNGQNVNCANGFEWTAVGALIADAPLTLSGPGILQADGETLSRLILSGSPTITWVSTETVTISAYTSVDWDGATFVASTPTSQTNITNPSGMVVLNMTVSDNAASNLIDATDLSNTDGGNTTNWDFPVIAAIKRIFFVPFHTFYKIGSI